jgi:UDP-N-acetylmuramoyl-tripeptide--D-alanyl-D-alanine ligase
VIPLDLEDIGRLCPGTLQRAADGAEATGVQIDSRRIARGDLFVAVGAGQGYVDDALVRGAAAALVPDDPFAALAALGRAVRDRSAATVIAITGSTGKTSTKDILAAICAPRRRTVAAEASYNNELGVPLTLCRLEPDTEICILELAMRGMGQIAELAEVARPSVAVVTNVGPAHLELVGSLAAVAAAKHELVDALPPRGVAIVPDHFEVKRHDVEVVRRGTPEATTGDRSTTIRFEGREITFSFRGRHQAENALSALLAARAVGLEVEGAVEVSFSRWRGEDVALPGGGLLVNDCYNANPASMRAALEDLADRAGGRRTVAVLGEMAELGADAEAYHREIGALVGALDIDVLVAVGGLARHYVDAAEGVHVTRTATDATEATRIAAELLEPGDYVLVKGSRVVGLEVVVAALAGGEIQPVY